MDTFLDILKTIVGLLYLYLEYKAKPSLWIVSIIMPCIGMALFFSKGIYGDFAMNIYCLVIAVYGYIVWTRTSRRVSADGAAASTPSLKITHVGTRRAVALTALWLGAWVSITLALKYFTDSTVPVLDAFTTSLSIVGMWMLARKIAEQWLVWFVVDAVCVYLYYIKGIYFSGSLYLFYTIMALVGYRKWLRLMHSPTPD